MACDTYSVPGKNTIKTYVENSYYHIYNRGIEGREIFIQPEDCIIFQHYLKTYLSSPEKLLLKEQPPQMMYKILNLNLYDHIRLLSFACMPNHFHLQVKQISKDGMQKLIKRVLTGYVQYFNRKYKRKGPLFESVYKAVLSRTDEQHLYLSSYIHRNPMKLKNPKFDFGQFSSYPYYLGEKYANWLNTEEILSFFRSAKNMHNNDKLSYQSFVVDFRENPETILGDIALDVD